MSAKKILSAFLISSLIVSFIPNTFAVNPVDFNVKMTTAGDDTYTNTLSNVSRNNTDVTFQFVEVSPGWWEEYSLNLPAGFTYQSSNTNGTTCAGFSVLSNTNGNFHFSFNGAPNCLAKTEFTYRITLSTVATNQTISLLQKNGTNWNSLTNIMIGVTASNTITKALIQDVNGNGFIDAYLLSFATGGVNSGALSAIKVGGITPSTITQSGSNWLLNFTDGVWDTGNLPQITGVFDTINLTNGSVNEEDGAKPQMMKINGVNLQTLWAGQSISIGNGAFDIEFSEKMTPTSTGTFSLNLGATPVNGTYTFNTTLDKLTFTPSASLSAGTYTLSSTMGASDWSSNSNALSQTFLTLTVIDMTAPVGSSIGSGSGILINAGNLATNNPSVQLQLLASDTVGVADMMISNDVAFSGTLWELYATNKYNWNLTTGTGTKTVYVKFRDFALNVSPIYSDTIIYDNLLSYANFDTNSFIYTNTTSVVLSGACNYISSTGAVLGTTLNTFINATNIGTVTCTTNHWTQTFTGLTPNSANTLRVEYTGNSTVNSTIVVTNPIPTCTAVTNGSGTTSYPSCNFTCNTGYTKVGGACVANNCSTSTQTINTRTYTVPGFNNATTTSVTTAPIAIPQGTITYMQAFSCTLGNTSVFGTETTNTPICSSGYQANGASCTIISSGGGGWWGGGGSLSTPPITTISTGTTSAGITSTGITTLPVAPWIPSGFNTPSGLSIGTIDGRYFPSLGEARVYLLTQIWHPAIVKLINTYGDKLTVPDILYYLSIDRNFYSEYNRIINAYTLLFLRVQDAVSGNRSDTVKSDWRMSVGIVMSGVTFAKNFLDKYVTREYLPEQNITLYRTKNPLLVKPLSILENKVLAQFNALLSSETISRGEYETSVQAYDDFVLHLMIYRDYGKSSLSKDRALAAIKIFTTTYAKKVLPRVEPIIIQTSTSTQKIGAIYTFSRDLKFGETSQYVRNLQAILKSYGYFDALSPTGYFGASTKAYLIKFSKEILKIDNPNGLFNAKIRGAIISIEVR